MISLTVADFWRHYRELDAAAQEAASLAYGKFKNGPFHPSLRFKKLGGYDAVRSVRINENIRAVGLRTGDTMTWFWIGLHKDFDKRFRFGQSAALSLSRFGQCVGTE
jgi:hypothetical protein